MKYKQLLPNKKGFLVVLIGFLLMSTVGVAQSTTVPSHKGKFYFFWGWNRGSFSNSDIRFNGANYDFTLYDVKAKDRMTPFSFNDYFNLTRITIPQTNFKLGYFLNDNYTISIGVDHMKYVMTNGQSVAIDGRINAGTPYDKVYANENILLDEDFLTFEHTDGLNYVNVEFKRFDDISALIGMHSERFQLNLTEGVGAGFLFPKTNTTLFGQERYDEFHVSGWGISAAAGINFTFFKHFFVQTDFKYGYINMPNIRTTKNTADSASQHFTFFEKTLVFGGRFRLF
ncbi:membrane protein [Polaribacter pacificus]|uniref:Membrane protein n=1 Tax=Polaribacter pacificus TaxID=1775173 RepID=A0A917I149_9FLAO|nr:hypothetical protein [Polaribacter pacificus]GGH02828.1 membrane protein [Polaribacter pacificus]